MNLRNVLVRLDEALGHEGRSSLRPAATAKQIAATAAALEMPLPPTLRDLYEWHDGETPSSTLFHDALDLVHEPRRRRSSGRHEPLHDR